MHSLFHAYLTNFNPLKRICQIRPKYRVRCVLGHNATRRRFSCMCLRENEFFCEKNIFSIRIWCIYANRVVKIVTFQKTFRNRMIKTTSCLSSFCFSKRVVASSKSSTDLQRRSLLACFSFYIKTLTWMYFYVCPVIMTIERRVCWMYYYDEI